MDLQRYHLQAPHCRLNLSIASTQRLIESLYQTSYYHSLQLRMPSSPRPILKSPASQTKTATATATTPLFPGSLHVHFPPSPTMTQTEITHSSFSYDRKPIVVGPNACALPARFERAMDASPDAEYDLELWPSFHRKRAIARGGYFHSRAYEPIEADAGEGDLPEQFSSSLLFSRDSSCLSSPYQVPNDTLCDTYQSHVRPTQIAEPFDDSDTASDTSTAGNFHLNGAIDACQFIQNIPHMDLSLSFLPAKQRLRNKKEFTPSPKKRSNTRSRTIESTTNPFERTRQAVRNAGCGGFSSGLYDSGLDGCLGGF